MAGMAACHKKAPLAVTPAVPQNAPAETAPATPAQTPAPPAAQRRPRATPQTVPASNATPAAATAEPEFKLGRAVTPDQERATNAEIDRHIQHATQILESISNHTLTSEQKSSAAQIRGFISQAQQMRATDVVRARSLAERADILSQDLASNVK